MLPLLLLFLARSQYSHLIVDLIMQTAVVSRGTQTHSEEGGWCPLETRFLILYKVTAVGSLGSAAVNSGLH